MTGQIGIITSISGVSMSKAESLSPARRRLLELVENHPEWTLKGLSVRIGKSHAYLHQYIHRGAPRKLDGDDRQALAQLLNCEENELLDEPKVNKKRSSGVRVAELPQGADATFSTKKDLPILGNVKAGEQGFFLDNGIAQGMTHRPEALVGIKDAYAVYVHDESMIPAYKPGWLLWVDPSLPPRQDDTVIVQLHDGQAFVKDLKRRARSKVICKQYNPPKDLEFKDEDVAQLHVVIGTINSRA